MSSALGRVLSLLCLPGRHPAGSLPHSGLVTRAVGGLGAPGALLVRVLLLFPALLPCLEKCVLPWLPEEGCVESAVSETPPAKTPVLCGPLTWRLEHGTPPVPRGGVRSCSSLLALPVHPIPSQQSQVSVSNQTQKTERLHSCRAVFMAHQPGHWSQPRN